MRGHSQKILASISAGIFYTWIFILWLYLPNLDVEAAGKYPKVGILEWKVQKLCACVRGKRGDLLTCSKNFCVNKRQLLPISRFSAKLQYILPLRSFEAIICALSCRVMFLIEISTSLFEGLRACLTLSQEKGGGKGVKGVFTMFLWFSFFFKHFWTKTAALHWLAIFAHFYRLHMVMLWKR